MLTSEKSPWELQEVEIGAVKQKWFVNGPQSLRELFEENISDEIFYVYENERYTYRDIFRKASCLGSQLQRMFNIKPGDRVAIAMRNYPEWPIALEAITSIGAIAVAVNAWWQPEEIEYALELTGVSVIIADAERIARISPALNLEIITVRCEGSESTTPIEHLMKYDEPMPLVTIQPDDNAVILFTSGSTGHPKGSVSTHRNILAAILSWEVDFATRVISERGDVSEQSIRKESRMENTALLAMPLFHVNGLHAVLLSAFRAQRTVVSMYKWDAASAANLIETENVATIIGTPAMTGDLVEYAKRTNRTLDSLRSAGGGGAARATSQVEGISQTLKNADPFTAWGMTETNSIGTGIYGRDYEENPRSSGKCSVVLEIATVDNDGNILPPGERGELVVRGTSVIHGYWNRTDANQESFIDNWFRTGDIAVIDERGHLFIVDRLKQLIIRGGENIGCGEVEDALLDHPEIVEDSVYGVPDQRLGEVVAATIYVNTETSDSAIFDFLKPRLAKFKIPQYIKISANQLPRVASGKIDKRRLRAAHVEELSTLESERPS